MLEFNVDSQNPTQGIPKEENCVGFETLAAFDRQLQWLSRPHQ
jgi:hypothetical protein